MKVAFVVGPTASGKSAIAIELAKRLDGEIISADAIAVYKRLDIGSAKPARDEQQGIRHHMLSVVEPDQPFSVAEYHRMAIDCIQSIFQRKKQPIVVGGTGLYVHSLIHPLDADVPADEAFRAASYDREKKTPGCLHAELAGLNPDAALRIHPNDIKRTIRALELNKAKMDGAYDFRKTAPLPFTPVLFGLSMEREELYRRIEKRVDAMLEKGLMNETLSLHNSGLDHSLPALQGLGYKQLLSHIRSECSFEEAIDAIKRETRRFAKRQMTWFRRESNIIWFKIDDSDICGIAYKMLLDFQSYMI